MNKLSAFLLVCSLATTGLAQACAIRDLNLFTGNTLTANDDGSTALVNLGFNIDFFGLQTASLFVNNNGNVTFDQTMETYTPFGLQNTNRQLLAPFFPTSIPAITPVAKSNMAKIPSTAAASLA